MYMRQSRDRFRINYVTRSLDKPGDFGLAVGFFLAAKGSMPPNIDTPPTGFLGLLSVGDFGCGNNSEIIILIINTLFYEGKS